ncbi:MetQ/NlpA family ABC transporter substrate-binding protein [Bacillus atrophaeus]|uniref:MetQ/NlpA family ABC transporter substrate-binding protein n=1 Tax=Bacillus atrophaeus TaxID=1452 RepID=UPI00228260DC|nr:MetQ/NlpA family ABC transporter substrate-binding protein [Bacillus atrophaeus]MCY8822690.1 MetQ/NlpA family ABC transporter substrate-binding protein [Bacillus atrophaeus]
MFEKWFPNVDLTELWSATYETLYMTLISLFFAFIIGIILGLLLFLTAKGSLWQNKAINSVIAAVVNVFRSIPFLILIILLLGFTKILVGTILGPNAALPALVIGSAPFYARLVEIALREVDKGVIEAAKSMGAKTSTIIFKVLLPESMPALISGITVTAIALIGSTAIAGAVHLEPFGIYSKKYKSLKDLPDGATIILTNNVAEQGRMLAMLQNAGLITLDSKVEAVDATQKNITKNPKNLKFKKIAPELTAKAYENKEGDAAFINVNYAIQNKLNPKKDAIEVESTKNNPYANIIAVRKGEEDSKKIKALMEVLHSKEIKNFIDKKYDGSVLPVAE